MVSTQADLVLVGVRGYTGTPQRPWVSGIAVAGGRIIAVGTDEDVRPLVGPGTRVLDLPGRMVVAGFQDSHVHPDHGGLARARCDLHELKGVDAYREAVAAYASAHPEAEWILGGGWRLDDFPRGCPDRRILDAIVPDRPVYLPNRDGHGAWVNSRALQVAGLNASTPDPDDGRIERDDDGEPQGTLHEGAMDLVEAHVPPTRPEEWEAALLEAQRYLHSLGIVAWQDAWATEDSLRAYRSLAERGELTARVVAAMWWDRHRGQEQVEELVERRRTMTIGRLRATSVKVMQDGIPENFTAGMLEPYLEPRNRTGLSFVDPDRLREHVTLLDREGFQVHVHAIGDRAVREALDAFEAARAANGANDLRHHVAHIQVVHPDDVPRFAELGVVANAQPFWACLDGQMRDLVIPFLGPERSATQYPFGSLRRSGARLAFGSDWPVTTPNPLHEMQVAVTRVPFEEPDLPAFLPGERLDLGTALDAFTSGTAFVNHLDDVTGTIEPGKLADLAVIDRDLFEVAPEEIGEARVVLTLVEGEPVHADPSAVAW
jgi:predicted amidohydrolase YtcJ